MRDIDLVIDGYTAPREVFHFEGTEQFGEILDISLYTFKPKELVLVLQYEGEDVKKVLTLEDDYKIYEFPTHEDGKSMERRYEILLREMPTRPATVTVVRPFFGNLEKEQAFIEAQKAPQERADKGAHKSFNKKKSLRSQIIETLTGSVILDFILTFSMAVAVFVVAVNIFHVDPATAVTLMMVCVAVYNFIMMKK